MSQRYVPSNDTRYPRERSPPRLNDRYDAPRGPRGGFDATRGSFSSRGRGFGGRGDYRPDIREREPPRDSRDSPPPAWSNNGGRSWREREFDSRDRRPSPRARPIQTDSRDFRDAPPRDVGIGRGRSDSRDGNFPITPQSATFRDGPPGPGRGRGSFFHRGRGRGDLDGRGRGDFISRGGGRGSFADDRESIRARSRSPRGEDRWDRDSNRDPRGEFDRRIERRPNWRDDDRPIDRQERDRDAAPDRFRRDTHPTTNDNRRASAPSSRPDTPPMKPPIASTNAQPKMPEPERDVNSLRRVSSQNLANFRDNRQEHLKSELPPARMEASTRKYASGASSPLQAPQVPAFGSLPFASNVWRAPQVASNVWKAPVEPKPPQTTTVPPAQDITPAVSGKPPPTAPKAEYERPPPTGPKIDPDKYPPTGPKSERSHDLSITIPRPPIPPPNSLGSRSATNPSTSQAPFQASTQSASKPPAPPSPAVQPDILRSPPTQPRNHFGGYTAPPPVPRPEPLQTTQAPPRAPLGPALTSPASPMFSPPLGPRGNATYPSAPPLAANIPTGPRAERLQTQVPLRPPIPPPSGPNRQWNRPPPTMPTFQTGAMIPAKRDAHGEEKTRMATWTSSQQATSRQDAAQGQGPAQSSAQDNFTTFRSPQQNALADKNTRVKVNNTAMPTKEDTLPPPALSIQTRTTPSPIVGPAPLETLMDDEDAMDLDETDFEEREAKFERQKAELEMQKIDLSTRKLRGATPLESLAFLGRMAIDLIPIETLRHTELEAKEVPQLLTPKAEEADAIGDSEHESQATASMASTPSIGTPDLRALPFLAREPLTPLSELDVLNDSAAQQHIMHDAVAEQLEWELSEQYQHENKVRDQYATLYRPWRDYCDELDHHNDDDERPEPLSIVPTSVVAVLDTPTTPAATSESRRTRGGLSTEYDLQKVLEESMLTAHLESANREKEALGSKPDLDREAVIPNLLSQEEQVAKAFRDTSQLKSPSNALAFYQLTPYKDTFTEEEHRKLVVAYREDPKQFGIIARQLPGRDFKDCINHYYATKWNGEYKPPRDKRRRKGKLTRAGYPMPGRPKASALISNRTDVYDPEDYNNSAVAVTDSGRPRRAAAPTFGDKEIEEQAMPAPVPGRRGPKPDVSGEPGIEKVRKPRGPTREKSQKKVKPVAMTGRHLSMSPEKTGLEPSRKEVSEMAPLIVLQAGELDAVSSLAAMHSGQYMDPSAPQPRGTVDYESPSLGPNATIDSTRNGPQQRAAGGASSYWSKQEERDFPRYLGYYGTDWQAIALDMGTKTHTMVKNYYNRMLGSEKQAEMEALAMQADEKRQRGDKVGAPPTPGMVARKRNEPTPSNVPRAIAPHKELVSAEDRSTQPSMPMLNRPISELHPYSTGPGTVPVPTQYGDRPPSAILDHRSATSDHKAIQSPPPHDILPHQSSGRHVVRDALMTGMSPNASTVIPVGVDRGSVHPPPAQLTSDFDLERAGRGDSRSYENLWPTRVRQEMSGDQLQQSARSQQAGQYRQTSPKQYYVRPPLDARYRLFEDKYEADRRFSANSPIFEPRKSIAGSTYPTEISGMRDTSAGINRESGTFAMPSYNQRASTITPTSDNIGPPPVSIKPEPRKTSNLMSILNADTDSRDSRKPSARPVEERPKSPPQTTFPAQAPAPRSSYPQQPYGMFAEDVYDPASSTRRHPQFGAVTQEPYDTSNLSSRSGTSSARPVTERDTGDTQPSTTTRSDWSSRAGWAAIPPVSSTSFGSLNERPSESPYPTHRSSLSGAPQRHDSGLSMNSSFGYHVLQEGSASAQHPPPPPPPAKYQSAAHGPQSYAGYGIDYRVRPPSSPPGHTQNPASTASAQYAQRYTNRVEPEYRARYPEQGPTDYRREPPRDARDAESTYLPRGPREQQASILGLGNGGYDEPRRSTSASMSYTSSYAPIGAPREPASTRPTEPTRHHVPPPPPSAPNNMSNKEAAPYEPRFARPAPMESMSMRAPSWTSGITPGPANGLGLNMSGAYSYGSFQSTSRTSSGGGEGVKNEYGRIGGGSTGDATRRDSVAALRQETVKPGVALSRQGSMSGVQAHAVSRPGSAMGHAPAKEGYDGRNAGPLADGGTEGRR